MDSFYVRHLKTPNIKNPYVLEKEGVESLPKRRILAGIHLAFGTETGELCPVGLTRL